MSKIKTAWELALERTKDIVIEKEAINRDEAIRKGKAIAGRYLIDPKGISLERELDIADTEHTDLVRESLRETLLSNLSLLRMETDLPRIQKVADGLQILGGRGSDAKKLKHILKQCLELFGQYLNAISQMEIDLRDQWESVLRQKEQALRRQTGQTLHLAPEQDTEYVKALANQLAELDARFMGMLNSIKEEIRKYTIVSN